MKSVYTKKRKKIMALLLAAAMLISAVSFAEETKGQPAEDAAMDESFIEDEADFISEPTVEDLPLEEADFQPPTEESPADEPADKPEPVPNETLISAGLESWIAVKGHAYVTTSGTTEVYPSADNGVPFFSLSGGAVLLATELIRQANFSRVKVWWITGEEEALTGYVAESALSEPILTDEEASALAGIRSAAWTATDAGELLAFTAAGEKIEAAAETPFENPLLEKPEEKEEPAKDILPEEPPIIQPGDYRAVTPATKVYSRVEEIADEESCMGAFITDAVVQVERMEQDAQNRCWLLVRYLYGDDFADGTLKWADTATVYVLASETAATDVQALTVTDYALPDLPQTFSLRSASPMKGFSLKTIHAPIPSFSVGQSGLYGSSGKDSDYLQIAKSPDHGTIYATPHYLEGFTVYCLEHNLSGPGENISGGGQQPKGPYLIVDMDSYRSNPGYSSILYHESTLHAIGWVLRHTYPFMALDRSDSDNLTWSRVAGQFAIRQVIREMEGTQYVRSYWNMDNFYRASGQAPAVYLEYARWLAANGIARGRITGDIQVSGQFTRLSGDAYVGTVTLTTDADRMRIRKSAIRLTGNSAGADDHYYYLNSGDTLSITSSQIPFTIIVESVSSEEEEASFLVGVPSAAIQKVLIPQQGVPYHLKSLSLTFEVPMGSIAVMKKDVQTGAALAGAVYELLNPAGTVLQTQTTGADGVASFPNLQPGNYLVREKAAPQGYMISVNHTQNVTVTAGSSSIVTFVNDTATARIRIVKKDQMTKEPLAGAEFTVTRLSAPAGRNGVDEVVAVLTTGADGCAETGWLDWGRYRIDETKAPSHFVDGHFSAEIDAYENGKTYQMEVENEPTKGWIRLTKTDRLNGNPIEGIAFDILYEDISGEELAATMVTGSNGVAVSPPLCKGRYVVREHGATAGYIFEEISLDAAVKPDETTELQATNQPVQVKLKLYKRDAEEYDGDNPNAEGRSRKELPKPYRISAPATRGDGVLTGAEFRLLAGENIRNRQGEVVYEKGAVVMEALKTQGEDASVTTGELWPGLYEVEEVTPPAGYQPSDKHFFVDARSAALQSAEAVVTYEGLKTNEILHGAFGIVKFTGEHESHSGAGVIETPEKGAEFEVYLKSAGSYENARDIERDYLVTNRYGRATTKALPYGVYVLRQTIGKEGYAMMRPMDVRIDGTENRKDPPTLILNNQALHYRLRMVKIDAETGKPIALAGTAFKLKDANGCYVTQQVRYPTPMELDTFLTNENGEVTLPETVPWGQYFIEEIKAPEGYLLLSESVEIFLGHTGDTAGESYEVTVEIPNTPVRGKILVEKKGLQLTRFETRTDAYGHEIQQPVYEEGCLAGAVFEIRASEIITGKDGTVWYEKGELADTLVTTAEGVMASQTLPLGQYYLIETAAPEGYVLDSTRHEVELACTDSQTPVVTTALSIRNEFLPAEITLYKEKEVLQTKPHADGTITQVLGNEPGEGFVFGLYTAKDLLFPGGTLMADTLLATGATDHEGKLTLEGRYPHGEYYIQELLAPAGWKLNPAAFPVTLDSSVQENGVIRVRLSETIHDELIYTEVTLTKTDITGAKPLPGAEIEVKNDQGEVIYRAVTDENGQIPRIPVTPGRYTFHEVLAPDGYALSEAERSFTVDESGDVIGDTVLQDDYTRVTLLKQNENGLPLAGVEFALQKEDGSTLMTAVSDELGIVTFEKIPFGSYTIVETAPLSGYLRSGVNVCLTVDGSFVNPIQPLATIVNRPMEILLHKVDPEGNPLAGAVFALLNGQGETVQTAVSDENGRVRFTSIPYGQYTLREMGAPAGFNRMEDISLVVDDSLIQPLTYTCVNIPNHYEFLKTDYRKKPLAGGKFALENAEGQLLQELVSDENGVVRATGLAPGRYVIREIQAPEGFNRSEETIELTIDEQYVPPREWYCFINYSGIQTGFEITMTPVMWTGAGLMLTAFIVLCAKRKKRRR